MRHQKADTGKIVSERDQGFTRCTTLVLLPFRSHALAFMKSLLALLPPNFEQATLHNIFFHLFPEQASLLHASAAKMFPPHFVKVLYCLALRCPSLSAPRCISEQVENKARFFREFSEEEGAAPMPATKPEDYKQVIEGADHLVRFSPLWAYMLTAS